MASIKDLRKRIGTVKNTQQTTKAMKMVSAAKLRRAQEAIQAHRPYALELKALLAHTLEHPASAAIKSPLVRRDSDLNGAGFTDASGQNGKSVLLVMVTSDRGLCGGFNANIIKGGQRWIKANADRYSKIEVAFVGKKAFDFFKGKISSPAVFHHEFGAKMGYARAKKLTSDLLAPYLDGRVQEVVVLYNEFKNAVTQKVTAETLVPLSVGGNHEGAAESSGVPPLVKPDPAVVAATLLDKHFPVQVYRILLESQAGEHGARMSAMENATKNAGEMIRHLTLQYNKQRQAGITKELLEIIAGSESQKSAG